MENNFQLKDLVLDTLEKHKAEEVVTLDVTQLTSVADYMVICTGRSSQHSRTLAKHLVQNAKEHGWKPYGTEGEAQGEWILIDLGDIVVHIMLAETRAFYSLEKLWNITEIFQAEDDH